MRTLSMSGRSGDRLCVVLEDGEGRMFVSSTATLYRIEPIGDGSVEFLERGGADEPGVVGTDVVLAVRGGAAIVLLGPPGGGPYDVVARLSADPVKEAP